MIRTLLTLCALVTLIAGAASGLVRAADDPYQINVIVSLTGPGALIGTAESQSLRLVEDLTNKHGGINGRPITFVIADDQRTHRMPCSSPTPCSTARRR
jgi:branched-chain amino acid transport system substrate-binding protein